MRRAKRDTNQLTRARKSVGEGMVLVSIRQRRGHREVTHPLCHPSCVSTSRTAVVGVTGS